MSCGSAERSEPGASRYGNFSNYYRFHPVAERVDRLPRRICGLAEGRRKFVCLDVGCNEGDLTLGLHKYLSENLPGCEVSILGIDLDLALIERAKDKNDRPESVTFEHLNFFSDECKTAISSYLNKHEVERFDVSFCFSVTMWVHLNHGDDGLVRLLRDLCAVSDSLLLEPQPWRCYREAARRLRRAGQQDFDLLPTLRYRGIVADHIQQILAERCGFTLLEACEPNDWHRRLFYYGRS